MDHCCLVLSGRLLDGQDAASVHTRMAAAFGMEQSGFRERVFSRAPLIIRRGLADDAAQSQAAQLRDMGVEADVWPDTDRLVWLRRDGQTRGPLPADALDHYAQAGDQWCHDGGQTWFVWTPSVPSTLPPPLPTHAPDPSQEIYATEEVPSWTEHASTDAVEPPPLPIPERVHDTVATPAPSPVKPSLSVAAVLALVFGGVAVIWPALSLLALLFAICALVYLRPRPMLRGRPLAIIATVLSVVALGLWIRPSSEAPAAAQYKPRPLAPLAQTPPSRTVASCDTVAATPKNDEDRFLLTGQRVLTGRAQRKGDTYVAEAASVDAKCQTSSVQLYVFHHGVFIGTALDKAAEAANTKLTDFDLVDDQHLRVTLAQCSDAPASCAATTVRQFAVMPGGGGWTLGEMK